MNNPNKTESPPIIGGNLEVEINQVSINWDLKKGNLNFFGFDSALFWTDPSLLQMLSPLAEEIGTDLFRLLIAHSSSKGTKEDYHAMISTLGDNFVEGFLAWGAAVSAAGWGVFELPDYRPASYTATVIVRNPWEMSMQRNLRDDRRWGCPFLQGKIIGIFNHAFRASCWAYETHQYDCDVPYVVFNIHASTKTIADELEKLRMVRAKTKERALVKEVKDKTADLIRTKQRLKIMQQAAGVFTKSKSKK